MPSMIERVKEYMRSRPGRDAVERAKHMATDRRTRDRVRHFLDRWRRGGSRH
ncbi:hypothetical protein TBS_12250 [Thermobispora bispora]|jgi:hypothetical protein|uniref:Uncharacterized protein n=1 Tax=Thermobispora bispora (strain ATCC 19993 / DSM 43833 / CBS 139.67 / JCM 10125 / KCTC 9307 / NBRC 14880 / R51) TaxID=469371 RepID=D6Y359_THEBD|nr:hypothetical protein [Thermobispora bispora]ADG88934.1 hypothetical protein Tbis_2224 [Thermobispora bispora DSM 43833]MBX6167870.1 hypothetical protein [Thermobispora bispora]